VFENRYNGVLEGWKVLLIRARARRLKFRGQDLDEAVQEVALALIDFRFDSAHPSQASEQTASDAVMQPWMTTELLEHTQRVWSPRYGYELSEEDAIEILTNTRRIAEALIRNLREDKTV